ncbi:MAG: TetR/AcrR family transcriptional regulator [Clostridia bacterium]
MIHMNFHKKNTSEKIKEATLNLLAEDGYDSISMRKIAKEAGVALGQLTYYYKTKDSLIVLVVKEVLEIFYAEVEEKVNKSEDKIEVILDGIESVLKEETKVEKLLITIISQSQVNKKLQKILKDFWNRIIDLITKCYLNNFEGITLEQANIKARLLIGASIESVVEKMLGAEFSTNNNILLIREAAKKLGDEK